MEARSVQYYPMVDLLRVLAIFGIVGCHLALPNMTSGAKFLNHYVDFNVGVFAAIAGFFFFKCKATSATVYFKSRFTRIVIPYLIWTVIYVSFSNVFHAMSSGRLDLTWLTPVRLLDVLFFGGSSAHLWFVAALFYFSVLLYPVRSFVGGGLCLVLSVLVLICCDAYRPWYMFYPVRFLGFFLLGGWLKSVDARIKTPYILFWLLPLAFFVGLYGLGFCPRHLFVSEWLVAMPLCVLAIWWSPSLQESTKATLRYLGALTFVIYLSHLLFTIMMREVITRLFPVQTLGVYWADQVVSFALALLFAHVLMLASKRFPALKLLYGGKT